MITPITLSTTPSTQFPVEGCKPAPTTFDSLDKVAGHLAEWVKASTCITLPLEKREEAAEIIQKCWQERGENLVLVGLDLMDLPAVVGHMTHLRSLNLSNNRLVELPEAVLKLKELTSLNLSGNPLESLPDGLGELLNLEGLQLNKKVSFTSYPDVLFKLPQGCFIYLRDINLGEEEQQRLSDFTDNHPQGPKFDSFETPSIKPTTPSPAGIKRTASDPASSVVGFTPGKNRDRNRQPPCETGRQADPKVLAEIAQWKAMLSGTPRPGTPHSGPTRTPSAPTLLVVGFEVVQVPPQPKPATGHDLDSILSTWVNASPQEKRQNYEMAATAIKTCIKEKYTCLTLTDLQLDTLPDILWVQTQLEQLNLGGNALKLLPQELCNLSNLTRLTLGENQLTILPDSFKQLEKLTLLDLSTNFFREVPGVVSEQSHTKQPVHLPKLTTLYLHDNPISSLGDFLKQRRGCTVHLPDRLHPGEEQPVANQKIGTQSPGLTVIWHAPKDPWLDQQAHPLT